MQDFVTRKQRLSKKDYSADFRLADSDDFFGFQTPQEEKVNWVFNTISAVVAVVVFWAVLVVWFSF